MFVFREASQVCVAGDGQGNESVGVKAPRDVRYGRRESFLFPLLLLGVRPAHKSAMCSVVRTAVPVGRAVEAVLVFQRVGCVYVGVASEMAAEGEAPLNPALPGSTCPSLDSAGRYRCRWIFLV